MLAASEVRLLLPVGVSCRCVRTTGDSRGPLGSIA